MLLEALDNEMYERYHAVKEQHRDLSGGIYQSSRGCFAGQALLINKNVGPHKDHNDLPDGWVATSPWGNWTGGESVFPALRVKFIQRAGDVLFSRSARLVHFVTPIVGHRYCQTHFTKKDLLESAPKLYPCGWCDGRFSTPGNRNSHIKRIIEKASKYGGLDPDNLEYNILEMVEE